jgi:hypothetical protein
MTVKIKNLGSFIDEFGEELYQTTLAYAGDKTLAKQKAKEIIDDIIENGLEQTSIIVFSELKNKLSYQQLCEKYIIITLEYISTLYGGELRWILS